MKRIIEFLLVLIVFIILFFLGEKMFASYNEIKNADIIYVVGIILIIIIFEKIFFYFKKKKFEYEITSIINHSFRTPLTNITWSSRELEKNLTIEEKSKYIQNINNATSKLVDILDIMVGVKDLEDKSSYIFKATSVRDIIEKSIEKYKIEIHKKNISFHVPTFKDAPLLTVDLKKISFVIDSILENSIFYTKENGQIFIDYLFDNKKMTIYISDNGIGLDSKDKTNIFSKFYRSKRAKLMNTDGVGLKLYLSKQIIKNHDGKIYAKSKGTDSGTTFFVELPFNK